MKTEHEIQEALTAIELMDAHKTINQMSDEEKIIADVLRWVLGQSTNLDHLISGFRELLEIRNELDPVQKISDYSNILQHHEY